MLVDCRTVTGEGWCVQSILPKFPRTLNQWGCRGGDCRSQCIGILSLALSTQAHHTVGSVSMRERIQSLTGARNPCHGQPLSQSGPLHFSLCFLTESRLSPLRTASHFRSGTDLTVWDRMWGKTDFFPPIFLSYQSQN